MTYKVYSAGVNLNGKWGSNGLSNIFVEQRNDIMLKGYCWPGDSAWIDFFNENARDFWASQYNTNNFIGTDDSFHIWLDMNEPSVFNGPENTMPKDAYHMLTDGSKIMSKDVKNAYGRMMIEAAYEGLIRRSPGQRPFILTRSSFFGTQKYGAKWTGDNQSIFDELSASIAEIFSLGMAGI